MKFCRSSIVKCGSYFGVDICDESLIFNYFAYWLLDRNEWLKFDGLGLEILSIALPAALALAADPLASLVDTAFVGHIGTHV